VGPIERTDEFDATIYTAEYVMAGVDEAIGEILEHVEEAWMRSPNVVLVIPRRCKAFKDTHDFLALGKLPGARQVRVSIASPDMSVASLARVLGFHIADLPLDHPVMQDDAVFDGEEEESIEKPTSPLPLGTWENLAGGSGNGTGWVVQQAVQVAIPKKSALTTSTWLGDPADYEAPGSVVVAPPTPRPSGKPASVPLEDRRTGKLVSAPLNEEDGTLDYAAEASLNPEFRTPHSAFRTSTTPSGRIKARSVMVPDEPPVVKKAPRGLKYGVGEARPFKWGRAIAVAGVLLVLALVGSLIYAFTYLPEATITLLPQTKHFQDQPVEITVLTPGGSPESLGVSSTLPAGDVLTATINAVPISAEIVEEGTRAASGTRQEPRGRAQGTMSFVNREPQAVVVPKGTRFTASNGVVVETTQAGTVPATVFGQTFGRLSLPIVANVEGPEGNLKEGAAAGVWKGLVEYYSSALEGGTLETFSVVTQEDIDALTAELRAQADKRPYGVIAERVPEGHKLITQTVALSDIVSVADRKAGEDGAEVKVRLTGQARASAYEESKLEDAVNQALRDHVDRTEPRIAGPQIDWNTVELDPPTVKSTDDGRVVYSSSASGRINYNLTTALADAIRTLAAGKEVRQARQDIARQYGTFARLNDLQAKVLWFNVDRLPSDLKRITVLPAVPGASGP
jgi:hypothetical protein